MTTIAYKDGIIAYDSRMTAYNVVVDDNFNKLFQNNGVSLLYCGDVGDIEDFLRFYFDNEIPSRQLDCEALVVTLDKFHCVDVVSDGEDYRIRKIPLRKDNHYAIGSGTKLSLAAMDMGACSYDAVKLACSRDIYSGGKIRTFTLP